VAVKVISVFVGVNASGCRVPYLLRQLQLLCQLTLFDQQELLFTNPYSPAALHGIMGSFEIVADVISEKGKGVMQNNEGTTSQRDLLTGARGKRSRR
jgi:hypothetical protein